MSPRLRGPVEATERPSRCCKASPYGEALLRSGGGLQAILALLVSWCRSACADSPQLAGCRPCLRAWALRPLVAVQLLAQLERPCRVSLRLRGHVVAADQSAHQVRAGCCLHGLLLPSAGRDFRGREKAIGIESVYQYITYCFTKTR